MPDTSLENIRKIIRSISFLEKHRRRYINEHLRDKNLHGAMFSALLFLNRYPGCKQDTLCEELTADKGNGARMCRNLEKLGYIRRQQSSIDRRKYQLYLTEEGEALIPGIHELLNQWRMIVSRNMTEDENRILMELLTHMSENVQNAIQTREKV